MVLHVPLLALHILAEQIGAKITIIHTVVCDKEPKLGTVTEEGMKSKTGYRAKYYYLLTNWLAYLCGRIQSLRPDVMPDRREGIMRAAGFGFVRIYVQASL